MTKRTFPTPLKIGLLLIIGLSVIGAGGLFSYNSLVKVVKSLSEEKVSQSGLSTIRQLTAYIEHAENNMRLYGITRERSYREEYLAVNEEIDSAVQILYSQYPEDPWFVAKIDTIKQLVEHKRVLWYRMSDVWQQDASSQEISDLSHAYRKKEAKDTTAGFFKRLFKSGTNRELEKDSLVLERLSAWEKDEKAFESDLTAQEIELAAISRNLSKTFNELIGQLEAYEANIEQEHLENADKLTREAYQLMAIFSLAGVLIGLFGLLILVQYIRKNQAYNRILERSRYETEQLAKSKELFMARVSHEIRTPLNAITGFIKQILSAPLDKNLAEKLRIVDSAGDQLIRLINDVLDFSKLQSGKLTLNNEHFNPGEVVAEVCELFGEMARKNGNVIEMHVEDLKKIVVYGDIRRFQQILYNLLSNATKFTENGSIEVNGKHTKTGDDPVNLSLVVSDTGPGIESDKLEKIFEEYTQADNDVSIRYGGTGLGLSIVKRLVELFDGTIRVESRKGSGTQVILNLKLASGDQNKIPEKTKDAAIHFALPKGIRILVADDEPYNRSLIAMILDKWKVEYRMVKNGLEAIEILKEETYPVVLMDIRMPVIDGIMATRFIRETLKLPKDKVCIIGITADIADQKVIDRDQLFNRIIVKPFSEKMLFHAVYGNKKLISVNLPPDSSGKAEPEVQANLSNLISTAGNDMEFVREMIDQFERSTKEGLEEIKAELNKGNYPLVADLAHKLAPACRHLEIYLLLSQLKEIENQAEKEHKKAIMKLIRDAEQTTRLAVGRLNDQYRKTVMTSGSI